MVVVQRTSSDLKLNPHHHGVFLPGDWTCAEGGGEDGQYEYVACARVAAGGVVTLLVSGSPETYSDLGGVEQVGKAAAALKGFPPKK